MNCNSEVLLHRSKRKADINITGGSDTSLYSTIPFFEKEKVSFFPNEPVDIDFFNEEWIYHFSTVFKTIVKKGEKHLYEYKIRNLSILPNKRKEKRMNTQLPAFTRHFEELLFFYVLDISKSGMKIESKHILPLRDLSVSYVENHEVFIQICDVVWKKKEGNLFYYGLRFKSEDTK